MKCRNTQRKDIIRYMLSHRFENKPVLLEELCWATFVEERERKDQDSRLLPRAYRNSFARTVREHMPELMLHKQHVLDSPIGVIARAAVFRVRDQRLIEQFVSAKAPHIVVNTSELIDYVSLERVGYFVRCRLYKGPPVAYPRHLAYGRNYLDRVLLPLTIPISVVCQGTPNDSDLKNLAESSWAVLWARRGRPPEAAEPVSRELTLREVLIDRDGLVSLSEE